MTRLMSLLLSKLMFPLIFFRFFHEAKIIIKQWKKQLNAYLFQLFLESFSKKLTDIFKAHIKDIEFSLLGALYFDKLVRKLKNFIQFLSDKPVTKNLQELIEISTILSCENLEEVESYLNEKPEIFVNKLITIDDLRDIIGQRIDFDKEKIALLLKNFI